MNWLATLIAYLRHAFPCLPPGEVPHVPAGPPLPAGEGPGVGLPFHGAVAPPHSQRPQRGQTTVTAGLDLRIATTSHTCTTPTGSHGREKANPSMCDLSEVGSILRGLVSPQVKTCGYANATSPRSVGHLPRRGSALTRCEATLHARRALHAPQGPSTRRSRLTRAEGTLHGAIAPFNGGSAAFRAPQGQKIQLFSDENGEIFGNGIFPP